MNTDFIEALKKHLAEYEFIWDRVPSWVLDEICAFASQWPSNPDNPANWPEVYHVRSYGDMTKEQFDEYISRNQPYSSKYGTLSEAQVKHYILTGEKS